MQLGRASGFVLMSLLLHGGIFLLVNVVPSRASVPVSSSVSSSVPSSVPSSVSSSVAASLPAQETAASVVQVRLHGASPARQPSAVVSGAPVPPVSLVPEPRLTPAQHSEIVAPLPPPDASPSPLLTLQGVSEARYYLPREVADRAQLMHDVTPDFFHLSLPPGPSKTAILRLFINEFGAIDRVAVEDSSLAPALLEVVLVAYRELRFRPAKLEQRDVKSQMQIEVRFESSAETSTATSTEAMRLRD